MKFKVGDLVTQKKLPKCESYVHTNRNATMKILEVEKFRGNIHVVIIKHKDFDCPNDNMRFYVDPNKMELINTKINPNFKKYVDLETEI